jgi:hypothetical protein
MGRDVRGHGNERVHCEEDGFGSSLFECKLLGLRIEVRNSTLKTNMLHS